MKDEYNTNLGVSIFFVGRFFLTRFLVYDRSRRMAKKSTPKDKRLTRADTKLAQVFQKRGLSYEAAALAITKSGHKVGHAHLGRIARGWEPPAPLARAIVAWVNDPEQLVFNDLIPPT